MLDRIFRQYTGNEIPLGEALRKVRSMLPSPVTPGQMDAYLAERFAVYMGVVGFIRWCAENGVLFMVNTTGMMGYFQRVCRTGRIPPLPALSASPALRFPSADRDFQRLLPLREVEDKAANTASVMKSFGIDARKVVLIGDSGGDGPHFDWGAKKGVTLVGSMTKPSLERYCRQRNIRIHRRFGKTYQPGEAGNLQEEMAFDFMELTEIVKAVL
jgi:hypothetical protein